MPSSEVRWLAAWVVRSWKCWASSARSGCGRSVMSSNRAPGGGRSSGKSARPDSPAAHARRARIGVVPGAGPGGGVILPFYIQPRGSVSERDFLLAGQSPFRRGPAHPALTAGRRRPKMWGFDPSTRTDLKRNVTMSANPPVRRS